MRWKIDLDSARGFVRAIQSETYSAAEEAKFLNEIFGSDFWRPGLSLMIDYSGLSIDNVESEDVENTSDLLCELEEHLGASRLALLCDTDDKFGVGRQFQMMVETQIKGDVRVFRDEEAAIEWLTNGRP